jgi:hypothetical protein
MSGLTTTATDTSQPSDAALAASYQMAVRMLNGDEALIWNKTALFVALNSLVIAALYNFRELFPAWAPKMLVGGGAVFCILWHFAMLRAWTYHRYYLLFARHLEAALKLGDLGVITYGHTVTNGSKHILSGEEIHFVGTHITARLLTYCITALFGFAYLIILIRML